MDLAVYLFLSFAGIVSFVPLAIGVFKIKKLDKPFLLLLAMIICETGVAIYSGIQFRQKINNMPSLHLLTFLEGLFGGLFFYHLLEIKSLKRIVGVCMILFLLFTSYNSFFIQKITDYNYFTRTLESYLFLIYSFFYLYELLKSEEIIDLYQSAEFWVVISFLLYFGTSQFIQLLQQFIAKPYRELYLYLRHFDVSLVIIYYSLFAVGFWKKN